MSVMFLSFLVVIQFNLVLPVRLSVPHGANHQAAGLPGFHEHASNGDDNRIEDLVVPHGYQLEEHPVQTKDGFILTMYRIPGKMPRPEVPRINGRISSVAGRGRPPVLLQHGLLDSCAGFLLLGPKKALGLILADQGKECGALLSVEIIHIMFRICAPQLPILSYILTCRL